MRRIHEIVGLSLFACALHALGCFVSPDVDTADCELYRHMGCGGNGGSSSTHGSSTASGGIGGSCANEAACGEAKSGRICDSKKCKDGCRGSIGNSCPDPMVCTSTDSTAGMCVQCVAPTDCGTNTACSQRTCTNNVCGTMPTMDAGTIVLKVYGDCQSLNCNDEGELKSFDDTMNVYDDGNDCTIDACNGGIPSNLSVALGPAPMGPTPKCAGGFCDGKGKCVECNIVADCKTQPICSGGKCVPSTCINGTLDMPQGETDKDCGGVCLPCSDGQMCMLPTDCSSGVCTGSKCVPPTCSDVVSNGNETGIDCGGATCPKRCSPAQKCKLSTDCDSAVCKQGICQPPICKDGVKNGTETSVDCGPSCPTPCPFGP